MKILKAREDHITVEFLGLLISFCLNNFFSESTLNISVDHTDEYYLQSMQQVHFSCLFLSVLHFCCHLSDVRCSILQAFEINRQAKICAKFF